MEETTTDTTRGIRTEAPGARPTRPHASGTVFAFCLGMESSVLVRNLHALTERGADRKLLERVADAQKPSRALQDHRGHSSHTGHSANPELPNDAEIVFLGLDGPALVHPLLTDNGRRVMVVEPDAARLKQLLDREDLERWILSGQLLIYSDRSPDRIGRSWQLPVAGKSLLRLILLNGAGDDPDRVRFFTEVREVIESRERDGSLDTGATWALGKLAVQNAIENLARDATRLMPAHFWPAPASHPAVVVSAGPSLDRNLDELEGARDRVFVIAVDTAVQALSARGILPDFVVAVDPRRRNVVNLEGLDLSKTVLLYDISAHPALATIQTAASRTFLTDGAIGQALHSIQPNFPKLAAFGSVATAALEVAVEMGLSPIILIGQDLAFTDDREYCAGTKSEAAPKAPDHEHRWETDIRGRQTRTTLRLLSFRDWMEKRIEFWRRAKPEIQIVNATGAGILKRAEQANLGELAAGFSNVSAARASLFARATHNDSAAANTGAMLSQLRTEIHSARDELRRIAPVSFDRALTTFAGFDAARGLAEILNARELMKLSSSWSSLPVRARQDRVVTLLDEASGELLAMIASHSKRPR